MLTAQPQSEIQLSSPSSINLIQKFTTSSKMSQQVSSMKAKSTSTRSSRASPRFSFTDNPTANTPRRFSSHSNLSTPLTDSPQVLSFENVVGKVFNRGLIASLTSKDAVLKEVRDCIIRSDEARLKALNPYLHSYWRDLHDSSGCIYGREGGHTKCSQGCARRGPPRQSPGQLGDDMYGPALLVAIHEPRSAGQGHRVQTLHCHR